MKKIFCYTISFFFINFVISQNVLLQKLNELPTYSLPKMQTEKSDWLLGKVRYASEVFKSQNGKDLIITNGLISREFRMNPYFACFSFRNLMTPKEMIRAIQPEAQIEIDEMPYNVGGVKGQFEYAYMKYDWLEKIYRRFRSFSIKKF